MRRNDLQCLRAFSVLLVVVYHLNTSLLTGGFIGVDIFFVLSGYFVAQMLSDNDGTLRAIINFLSRRLSRLVPNLIFYILVTIPFVVFLYPPHLIKDFGQSISSNSFFLSNIFFYFETDYYNDFSRTAPLLHSWSLSVEIQYYLIIAILTYGMSKLKFNLILTITLISIVSLIAASQHINNDKPAVFYMMHYRFWELSAGYISFHLAKKVVLKDYRKTLVGISYLTLLYVGMTYSDKTVFPAFAAVPVVVCTCVLLLVKIELQSSNIANRCLIAVGDRSYSIYLSHNIFISIVTTSLVQLSNISQFLIICIGTTFVSEMSYRYIERRFQYQHFNSRKFLLALIVLPTIIASVGLHFHLSNGLRTFKLSQAKTSNYFLDYDQLRTSRVKFVSDNLVGSTQPFGNAVNRVLVLGDSKSEDLFILMNSIIRPHTQHRLLRLDDNCMRAPSAIQLDKVCRKELNRVIDSELLNSASHIILTATWQRQNISGIVNFVSYLENIGKSVAVVSTANFQDASSVALQLPNVPLDNFEYFFFRSIRDDWRRQYLQLREKLQEVTSAQFFEKLDLFCVVSLQKCNLMSSDFHWLIYDSGHLTVRGFKELAQKIEEDEWGAFND